MKERYKSAGALAAAIGMTDSGFSRAAKAGTFETENLLRLADETGEAANRVLEMGGKAHVNALIERLYGKAKLPKNPDAAKAAELMAKIENPDAREGFLKMLRGYLQAQDQARDAAAQATRAPRHR